MSLTAPDIGQRHHHLAVEAARTKQRRVKNIGTVGGRNDNHPLTALKTIHLHQKLVQGLLTLIMPTP